MSGSLRPNFSARLVAEALGTCLLLATVVGSGIMAAKLSGGNIGLALLANAIATGAILFVLITCLGPVSGAHFNPVVTLVMWLRRNLSGREALAYVAVQAVAALAGVLLAHAMFDLEIAQVSMTARTGPGQWISEAVAAFGLVFVILLSVRYRPDQVAAVVGLYITSAYWFTASTSFANPAVTVARAVTDTFAGIAPADVAPFIAAQIVGALVAHGAARMVIPSGPSAATT